MLLDRKKSREHLCPLQRHTPIMKNTLALTLAAVLALGVSVTSTARASFGLYNTLEEADAFVEALTKTRTFFS